MTIRVHIDRCVLNGIAPNGDDPGRLREAIERCLAALLGERGLPDYCLVSRATESGCAGMALPREPRADWLAAAIAGAVYEGLSQ